MNKTWILATMALTLAASCSRDRDVDNQDNNKIDDTTIEEIVLGTGQNVSVTPNSRGIGAVGDTATANSWKGETVYVYGINNNATGDAQFAINGQAATAPTPGEPTPATVASGALTWVGTDVHYYYNGNDVYDFYGAHVDDAVVIPTEPANATIDTVMHIKPAEYTDGFAIDVKIDGSQDLMVAKTNKAQDITDAENSTEVQSPRDDAKLYSAWSARRKVVPNLVFTHLLSRLNFQAKCGSNPIPGTAPDAKDMIKITKIEVLDVSNAGKLQIIPAKSTPQGFTPGIEAPKDTFVVFKESTGALVKLEEMDPVQIITNKYVAVGADLLVYPEEKYNIVIYTEQDMNKNDKIEENEKGKISWELKLKENPEGTPVPFKAGDMYDINITVYGLENIKVNATLTAWGDGEDIEIDPDDMPAIPEP